MAISAEERRARILDVVRESGSVRVTELAERLGLPTVTVRRDVAALAENGLLRRSHGSVSLPQGGTPGHRRAGGAGPVVGMLVPTVGSYFDEIIEGARSAATTAGARLVLGISPYEAQDDRAQVERILGSGIDGLLFTPNWRPGAPDEGDWLTKLPVPTVLVERRAAAGAVAADLDAVVSDHRHGVLLALRHLAALGHRSVLLAARNDTWTAHEVRAGYAEAARVLGIEAHPVVDVHPWGTDPIAPADPQWLADRLADHAEQGVRAVLVHNDRDAIQLPQLLRARGLRVPEDLALISYDDVFAALTTPPLTAVAPPKQAVGTVALDLLLRRMSTGSDLPAHHIGLLPTLVVRSSCGALPVRG
ncbi:substrate-binding domain-containing protein [Kitasatospora sp. NPDC096140]|uniref:substrate-binding domain-containing protein n=1 Tax=Kitasatospora sp. NPDC096140 TaxID=3155425 RepID=UPI00331EABD4